MAERAKMKRWFFRAIAAAIGVIFIYAGAAKTLDPAQFASDIRNFRLVPWSIVVLAALYLPWLEIVCGGALIFRRAYRGALWIVTALTLVFFAALLSAKMRGLDISCGCFGHSEPHGFSVPLIRDAALLAALGLLIFADRD
jgi:hypothetical protein